jgi:hypothetical protein
MINKVSSVKFTKTGYDDAMFDFVTVKAVPRLVSVDHETQRYEKLRKFHGYRLMLTITLNDVLQPDFVVEVQKLSDMFNGIIHTTNGTVNFFPDTDELPLLSYECLLDGTIEPFGDNVTNTGHGIAIPLVTVSRFTNDLDDTLKSLWFTEEEE